MQEVAQLIDSSESIFQQNWPIAISKTTLNATLCLRHKSAEATWGKICAINSDRVTPRATHFVKMRLSKIEILLK